MKAELTRVSELGRSRRGQLLALFRRYFEGVAIDDFERDLEGKDYALLLIDDTEDLVGFTSFAYETATHAGATRGVVYSGDTVTSPAAWNSSVLMPAWIQSVREVHATYGSGLLWWLLLTSGYRTYRFLPVLFREFWPRHAHSTPETQHALLQEFASRRYGANFDSGKGLVRFARPHRLRGELGGIPDARLRCPHVRFFARSNPGHSAGDELVCLTELSLENLTPAGRRMWERGERTDIARPRGWLSTGSVGRGAVESPDWERTAKGESR